MTYKKKRRVGGKRRGSEMKDERRKPSEKKVTLFQRREPRSGSIMNKLKTKDEKMKRGD